MDKIGCDLHDFRKTCESDELGIQNWIHGKYKGSYDTILLSK